MNKPELNCAIFSALYAALLKLSHFELLATISLFPLHFNEGNGIMTTTLIFMQYAKCMNLNR